jgi:hypothetical protein
MVECRGLQSQTGRTIDTAAATVTEGGALDVALLVGNAVIVTAGQATGRTSEREPVETPMRH